MSSNNGREIENNADEQVHRLHVASSDDIVMGASSDASNDDWVDPTPRSRRRQKDSKDDDKKKSKKKKKKKMEKGSSYFASQEQENTDGSRPNNNDQRLLRAPSEGYLPPPPRNFSRNNPESHPGGKTKKKRDSKMLSIHDDYERRPGVMRVRVHDGDVDMEAPSTAPTVVDLTTAECNGEDALQPPYSSTGDIMTQAELVSDAVIAVAATAAAHDHETDELKERVAMLEQDRAKREEGQGRRKRKFRRKRMLFCGILILALVGGTIGLFAYFVILRGDDVSPTEMPSLSPSTQPSSYPTASPSQFPSSLPTVDLEELWTTLIQTKSPLTTFENETSAESLALEWLVKDPFTRNIFNDTDRVLQRFALAVFWYATGATLGGGWLDDRPECNWGGTALRCDGDDVVVGFNMVQFDLSGTLPKELVLLSPLSQLTLEWNQFEGTIPKEIWQLTKLTILDISYSTDLGGTLSTEIGLLTELTRLYFGETAFEGTIPTEIGLLTVLELFAFYNNNFTSTIPTEIGLMTALTAVDVSGNSISGTVPSEIAQLTNIEELLLFSLENVSGSIPSSLCAPKRTLSIDCGETIDCTCCTGPWPGYVPC